MPTRRGTSYNTMESPPRGESTSGSMNIEQIMLKFTTDMNAQFEALRADFTDLREETHQRIGQLERRNITLPLGDPQRRNLIGHQRQHERDPTPPLARGLAYRDQDPEERLIRSVKIEAPSFEGLPDPTKFLDWLAEMEYYFEWYGVYNERRVRFAKIKLLGQAKLYWTNQERILARGGRLLMITWDEMKECLKKKIFLPHTDNNY